MTYRRVESHCLDCGTPLMPWEVESRACERCPHCGGVWIDAGAFLELLRASPTAQHPAELMVHNDGSPRRKCLRCRELMDLAWIDFLQLDHCSAHGVWLDPGELDRALESGLPQPRLDAFLRARQSKPKQGGGEG